jgi:Zn-dependent protease with chaperone function
MIDIAGKWYDGKTSARIEAVLRIFDDAAMEVRRADTGEMLCRQSTFAARVSDRLADTPRLLTFPGGAVFETEDNAAVDRLLAKMRSHRRSVWVHRLESRKRYVLAALLSVVLIGAGIVQWGIPAAAHAVAMILPDALYQAADRQTLTLLDRAGLSASGLPEDVRARVRRYMGPIINNHPGLGIKLVFRRGGRLGPNAFALPGGTILLTDEMVDLAEHDDELLAVMAHEIGHVVHRHGMRRMVQDSLLGFAIMALTGDTSGVAELFLGLPAVLTELAYSRTFERDADRYALNYLETNNIPPGRFADLLERIEQRRKRRPQGEPGWTGYLATHPPTAERAAMFRHAAPP